MSNYKSTCFWAVAVFFLTFTTIVKAQEGAERLPLVVTVCNNATLLPGSGKLGVFGIPVHPGFTVGTAFRYNQHPQNELFQTATLGYHYHHYVQHSLRLYSEFGYRRHFKSPWDAGTRLGIGYLHSIPDHQIFELDSEGRYQKQSSWGRPQFMASLAVEAGYSIPNRNDTNFRLFVAYQFYLQMPFVQEYVPLMPNTAFHLGVALPFFYTKK